MARLSNPGPIELAARVATAFESTCVRYVLGGSLASTAFGKPRATLDIDFVADLSIASLTPWLDALGPEFDVQRSWAEDEIARRGSFQAMHRPSMIRLDVFVPPWEGIHLWKWETRVRLVLDPESGAAIDVTSPAGIVLQKLIWYRETGESSDRQWGDVLGVLEAQRAHMDRKPMLHWARIVGVEDLLARALEAARR